MLLFCRLGYPVIVFNGCRRLKMKQGDIMRNELRELISTLAFIVAFVGFVYFLGLLLL